MEKDKDFLGTEPIGKLLLRLAIPTLAAQLINMLYNVVDRIYIGHIPKVGALALTGVGVCMPLIMLVSAFAVLVGNGGAPRASIYMGQNNKEDELKHTVITLSLACIINVASPSARLGNIILASSFIFFLCIFKNVFFPNKKLTTQIHEHACDTIVASAAPRTPICNPKIKIGSSTMLITAPISTDNIPVFANPCAVINAFNPSVNCTKIVPTA